VTEQNRRHASARRHRWPALLTILNKIPFISTKWSYKETNIARIARLISARKTLQ